MQVDLDSVGEARKLSGGSDSLSYPREPVPAQRGSILDVSGRVLAQSMPLIEVHLDGKILAQEPKELPVIASILGVSAEWLKGQVDPENRYLKVAEGISVETEGKLKASKLRSVITERKTARNYPNGSETAQILGYVNSMEVTPVGMAKPLTVEVGRRVLRNRWIVTCEEWLARDELFKT